MLFRRLYNDRLAQAAYLIACQRSGQAIVIDPLNDPELYLAAARQDGVRITMVAETHVHADFVSGAAALAKAVDAALLLSGAGSGAAGYDRSSFPQAHWLHDGDRIDLGQVLLEVLHVPGHTPEHVAFLVTDHAAAESPIGLVSGDFLFVSDVGRPDLLERAVGVTGSMSGAARELHASLRRLESLPDHLQVWPGHGAGSACGKALGAVPQSTLGYERITNWALQPQSETAFVSRVLEGQPDPPAYFARMKRINAVGASAAVKPRTFSEAELTAALEGKAVPVDIRPAATFAQGHLRGAVNVPLGKSFLSWAGSVIPPERDIVAIATPELRDAALAAGRELQLIGLGPMLGVLTADHLASLDADVVTLPSIPAASLAPATDGAPLVLDVRNRSEWDAGHMPGAVNIPLAELATRVEELRAHGDQPIAVHCQGGSRSAVAASVLQAAGFSDVSNVEGGFGAWARAGNRPATGT
jgi:hydroxyacylglutathione hydrolase